MAKFTPGRHTAEIDGDFVVFLIGARLNKKLKAIKAYRAVFRGMSPMLKYLSARPEKGLLGYTMGFPVIVQYWRSIDDLVKFANDPDDPHLAAWRNYTRQVHKSGEAGIWHETFLVKAGQFEAVYDNMPAFGLARAGRMVPVVGRTDRALDRIGS